MAAPGWGECQGHCGGPGLDVGAGVVREAGEDGYILSNQDKTVSLNMDNAVFLKARFIEKNLDIAFYFLNALL